MPERMSRKSKRKKRRIFSAEYKAEVVRLCKQPGKTPYEVAMELDLTPSAVSGWVKMAKAAEGRAGDDGLASAERAELAALRKEVKTLRQEREILRRAAAFFAKEGTT